MKRMQLIYVLTLMLSVVTVGNVRADEHAHQAPVCQETQLKPMRDYAFQFQWLPMLMDQDSLKDYFKTLLTEPRFVIDLTKDNGYQPPIAADDIQVYVQPDVENPIIVWTLPEPTQDPMCKYMAFVPEAEGKYSIYTLERSSISAAMGGNPWVLGKAVSGGHSSIGDASDPGSAENFVKLVTERVSGQNR